MAASRFIFLFLFITFSAIAQKPVSLYYWASTGKGHCSITLNPDSSYKQSISDCMYSLITNGRYTKIGDTLILRPKLYIKRTGDGKKTAVDSTSDTGVRARRMNKYLVKTDTSISQLQEFQGVYKSTWTLVKQPVPTRKRR